MSSPRVLLIASRDACADLPGALRAALSALPRAGAAVQLREKALPAGALLALARALLPLCREAGAPLVVNDRADVALAAGADGVHLPERGLPPAEARRILGPDALIGVSCHSAEAVAAAARGGADYALFAPVFAVPGKGPPQGLAALSAAARAAGLPVLALGGVDASNAQACIDAGARGVACVRSVLGAPDPAAAARVLWQAVVS